MLLILNVYVLVVNIYVYVVEVECLWLLLFLNACVVVYVVVDECVLDI
jgi:hypothetical protein